MRTSDFTSERFGVVARQAVGAWTHPYFLPAIMPRRLDLQMETVTAVSRATLELGNLGGLGQLVREPELLLGPSMAQEALASSRIEGTQASLSDVLSAETSDQPIIDHNLREVSSYLAAADVGVRLLQTLPLTQRFITELHAVLMRDVRGEEKSPGELRRSPVWIGSPDARPDTAKFIPPHQQHLPELLSDWERFVNDDGSALPIVVKSALMHYQFETIHPFLDGNGRIGRLLINFSLMADQVLPAPILHISGYFEAHRTEYYARLQGVRERGEIDEWIQFFSAGVAQRARESAERIRSLVEIRERYRDEVRGDRSALSGLVDVVFRNPVVTSDAVQRALGVSQPTASNLLRRAVERGWLEPRPRFGRGGRGRWVAVEVWDAVRSPLDE